MTEWRKATLGEVATITIGRTPPRKEPRYWTSNLRRPFCTIADMVGRQIDPQREGVTEAAENEGKAKRFPAGALMLSFKLSIGRVGFAARDIFPNEAIAWLRCSDETLDERFLALVLASQDLTAGSGRAVKGNTLNGPSLRAIPLSLPPLPEQHRIVDVMSAVDEQIEALDDEVVRVGLVRRATLRNAFDLSTTTRALKEVAEVSQGKSLPKAVQGIQSGTCSWFKIADMTTPRNMYGFTEANTRLPIEEVSKLGGRIVGRGAIVFPRVGAAVLTEKKRIMDVDAAVDENHLVLSPAPTTHPEFLLGVMELQRLGDLVQTGAVPSLNMQLIKATKVPWVDTQTQTRVGDLLGTSRELLRSLAAELASLRTFRTSLLKALLSQAITIPEAYDAVLEVAA